MQKKRFRIRNWSEYNNALINRGDLDIWIDEASISSWLSVAHTGRAGHPEVYSDQAILLVLLLREIYHLPLRSLQGFVESLFRRFGIFLPVPSYSQVSRRAKTLHKRMSRLLKRGVRGIIFDSTGLKIYGEGEWKVKVHGKGKRRTWRKFHIGLDADTQDIVMYETTKNRISDIEVAEKMFSSLGSQIRDVYGDGAYDGRGLRKRVHETRGRCHVPPPRNAKYKGAKEGWLRDRDAQLAEITGLGGGNEGRRLWKILSGYHRRSLVETAFSRIKGLFGPNLKARNADCQSTECLCRCLIINRMNALGLPKGRWEEVA